jgi:predicted NAD/FAD-binding protein
MSFSVQSSGLGLEWSGSDLDSVFAQRRNLLRPRFWGMLPDASADEREVLGSIRTQPNRAVLHTDLSLLPRRRRAWAAWNYEAAPGDQPERVCLHYLINRLQPLPWQRPVIVSLNPVREPDPALTHGEFAYDHPVFDLAAGAAQRRLPGLQGRGGVWFAGAWTRYGLHEDGFASGQAAARAIAAHWQAQDGLPARQAA